MARLNVVEKLNPTPVLQDQTFVEMSDPIGIALNDAEPGQEVQIWSPMPTSQEATRQAQERLFLHEANYEDFDPSELPF